MRYNVYKWNKSNTMETIDDDGDDDEELTRIESTLTVIAIVLLNIIVIYLSEARIRVKAFLIKLKRIYYYS